MRFSYKDIIDLLQNKYALNACDLNQKDVYKQKMYDEIYRAMGFLKIDKKSLKMRWMAKSIYLKQYKEKEPPYHNFYDWLWEEKPLLCGIIELNIKFYKQQRDTPQWVINVLNLIELEWGNDLSINLNSGYPSMGG